jgi:hypothetical protein
MNLPEPDAYQRLQQAARGLDPSLTIDRGSVHWRDEPYPGIAYSLVLGEARALLFMPAVDIAGPGWEQRLPAHLESAHRYLLGFTHQAR